MTSKDIEWFNVLINSIQKDMRILMLIEKHMSTNLVFYWEDEEGKKEVQEIEEWIKECKKNGTNL